MFSFSSEAAKQQAAFLEVAARLEKENEERKNVVDSVLAEHDVQITQALKVGEENSTHIKKLDENFNVVVDVLQEHDKKLVIS